jgi:hypothetical protein
MTYTKEINGKRVFFSGVLEVGDKQIINPTHEQLVENGWEVYEPPTIEPYQPTYEERVEQLIREKYSVSDELAIQRQRDTKKDEFDEYFSFCETCKSEAKNRGIERMEDELNCNRYE